ncbi:UbiA family prenyltransferase [Saccharomonospora sp. NPDC046836]|uniref:UbiA prenyltransferase family protein n=1 Tax=Saccharomonospora sp. NPDC046836 TaxID=3156921 RepID=UPI0034032067
MPRVAGHAVSAHDLLVLHRLQFPLPVTYVCYAAWGACFAVPEAAGLADLRVLAAIMANLLLIVGGLVLNNVVDVRTDQRHSEKQYLATATNRVGVRRALRWAWHELTVAIGLCVAIGYTAGRWAPVAIAVVTITATLLYNLEPIRLKRHGLAGPLVFGVALVGMPCLLSYTAARPDVEAWIWPVAAGVALLTAGRTVWWSVPDRAADMATGITTPSVRYGHAGTLAMACVVLLAGLLLLGWGLWWSFGPLWAIVGTVVHLGFLTGVAGQFVLARRGRFPSATVLLKRGLPVVMLGEVALVVVPLAA